MAARDRRLLTPQLVDEPFLDDLLNTLPGFKMLGPLAKTFLLGPHLDVDYLLRVLSAHAAQGYGEFFQRSQTAAKHLRAAARAVRKARQSCAPALRGHANRESIFDIEGLAKIADDLDTRATNMEPGYFSVPVNCTSPPPLTSCRGRGRPGYNEFNSFVLIMKWEFERTGSRATANYNDAQGEYCSPFINFLEEHFSKLKALPPAWPKDRKARARQIKSVLDATRVRPTIRASSD